jgi:cell division initiation protein
MKLTPLDIHHKEFRHSLRGYAEDEVDQFLDQVADELERLFKENIDLSERLEAAKLKINEFELQRQTINNTLFAAQRSADDIASRAESDAESVLREAEIKAKEIIHNALAKKQTVANELIRIKQAEEEFRARYRSMLESNLRAVAEIGLPSDVNVLLGDTDEGPVGDVHVGAAEMPPVLEPVAPAAPVEEPPTQAAQQPAEAPEPPRTFVAPEEPVGETSAMPPVDQASYGFVQSVALGEMSAPEIPQDVQLVEPGEFEMPSFDMLGERDDDMDIEEID